MKSTRSLALLLVLLTAIPFLSPLFQFEIFTLRDHSDYFVPLRYHTAAVIREGSLPLWNPWNGSGERWLANPQTGVFYPPAWLFLVLPFETAYVLFLAFHLMVLAVGFFVLLRRWVSPPAAFFGSVAAGLSGPVLSLLDISNNLSTLAWLPWLMATLPEKKERFSVRPAVLLTLAFLGGEPVLAFLAAVVWSAVVLASRREAALGEVGVTALITIALSAGQLVPFLELLSGSDRMAGLDPSVAFGNSMSMRDWFSMVVPSWGLSGGLLSLSQNYIPVTYLGAPVALLSVAAVLAAVRQRTDALSRPSTVAVVVAVAAIIAASAPQVPALRAAMVAVRMNAGRYPARFSVVAALAFAALAAFALERLPRLSTGVRLTAAAVVLAALAFFAAGDAPSLPSRGLAGAAFGLLALWMVLFCALPSLLTRRAVMIGGGIVLAADLYLAARPLLVHGEFVRRSAPWSELIGSERKVIRLGDPSGAALDPGNAGIWMGGYRNLLERKFDASTPAPVVPMEYLRIHDHALYDARIDLLQRLSVGYLITDREIARPGIVPVAARSGVNLYALPEASPFATAWNQGRPAERARASLWALTSNRAVVDVISETRTSVVLTQLDAPGWKVTIDGEESSAGGEKKFFRAIDVPAGRHRIVWEYDPFFVRFASVISILSVIAVVTRELIGHGTSARK